MNAHAPKTVHEVTPAWLTQALTELPGFAGRIVRCLHYEEVAAGPGQPGTVARFHLTFADAGKASLLVELPGSPRPVISSAAAAPPPPPS
jgi:hypothetical protein